MKHYSELARYGGNESLFTAVEMALISTLTGMPLHLHAQGLRGTGKTTIFRSAIQIIPKITRVKGCLYNCDPANPHCPQHRGLTPQEVDQLGVEEIPMPFLEISHSAKIGTVAGSIDLARITDKAHPEAALLPGIIPQAHRGVIFVDEINRLADTSPEITDILLDAMGTKPGRVQIEETGLAAVDLPVAVSVWAASNPDEEPGPLSDVRRQLSDRFDLVINMGRPDNIETVASILRQHRQVSKLSRPGTDFGARQDQQVGKSLVRGAGILPDVLVPEQVDRILAELYVKFGLESLRAIEAMQQAAQARAALGQRHVVEPYDLAAVLPWALGHRVESTEIKKMLDYLKTGNSSAADPQKQGDDGAKARGKTGRLAQVFGEPVLPRKARRLTELAAEEAVAAEGDL